jgi:hypothetical protein
MKKALHCSSRAAQRRRRTRPGSAGAGFLTLAIPIEFNGAVLYTEASSASDARPYPDATPSVRGTCNLERE